MFCQQCGTQLEEGMAFCTNCGAKQAATQSAPEVNQQVQQPQFEQQPQGYAQPQYNQQPQYNAPQYNQAPQGYAQPNNYAWNGATPSPKSVGFGDAIKLFFSNYTNFSGRATKSEYWYAYLFTFLVSMVTSWIPGVGALISVAIFLPSLAISVRRLHDTGKAWTYLFMSLIPLAGFIILIVQYCKDSDGDNKWGPAPRG